MVSDGTWTWRHRSDSADVVRDPERRNGDATDGAPETVTVRRRSEHRAMPWKNGAGTTYEIERQPPTGEAFDWRLSFAEVNSEGSFSSFPGIDRVITLVSGTAITLKIRSFEQEPFEHVLRPFEPFAFRGDDAVHAVPQGRTVDLNVMTARGTCTAVVSRLDAPAAISAPQDGEIVFLVCLDGHVHVRPVGVRERQATLRERDVAQLDGAAETAGDGVGLVIRLAPSFKR